MTKTLVYVGIATAFCSMLFAPGVVAQSFFEDFTTMTTAQTGLVPGGETVALPSGNWHAVNASVPLGITGWFGHSTELTPLIDGQFLAANFNATTGSNTINSFFMSPVVFFNNGDTINFFTRSASDDFPDRLRVMWSGQGNSTSIDDFDTVLLSINENLQIGGYPTDWTAFNITISGLLAPTFGRFAFNYNVTDGGPDGINSDFIGIDLVSYTAVPEPSSGLFLLFGLAFSQIMVRRRH
ncbi:MAG TPA: choice-of-anchor J domain-containing protein [Pirellulaceae bacterium]|nr:choice-of-anchor J domain-containing protein [Pirellulaceae bacterium]HMO91336.1 choice-of-anchor J domain-containing protein [Pirellulaceae bacterium]HMP70154.1 choice-of-anchor J domain-containing protein [Pirellulaceae bacterium]